MCRPPATGKKNNGGLPLALRNVVRDHLPPPGPGAPAPKNDIFTPAILRKRHPEKAGYKGIHLCVDELRDWATKSGRQDIINAVPRALTSLESCNLWVTAQPTFYGAAHDRRIIHSSHDREPTFAAYCNDQSSPLYQAWNKFHKEALSATIAQNRGAAKVVLNTIVAEMSEKELMELGLLLDIDQLEAFSKAEAVQTLMARVPGATAEQAQSALSEANGDVGAAEGLLQAAVPDAFMDMDGGGVVYTSTAAAIEDDDEFRSLGAPVKTRATLLEALLEKISQRASAEPSLSAKYEQMSEALIARFGCDDDDE